MGTRILDLDADIEDHFLSGEITATEAIAQHMAKHPHPAGTSAAEPSKPTP